MTFYPPITDTLQDAGEMFDDTFDIMYFISENARYPYRLIRAISVNPFKEAAISASLQMLGDIDNELSLWQRGGRGLWAGIEAGTIDVLSAPLIRLSTVAGAATSSQADGPLPISESAGATLGYLIGAVASNHILQVASDRVVTPYIYGKLNLYDPLGK